MKCDGTHTHIGGAARERRNTYVCARHHTRSYANLCICHLLVSFLLCHLRLAGRAWPCGAREAMKWGGLGQPPREYDFRVNFK